MKGLRVVVGDHHSSLDSRSKVRKVVIVSLSVGRLHRGTWVRDYVTHSLLVLCITLGNTSVIQRLARFQRFSPVLPVLPVLHPQSRSFSP